MKKFVILTVLLGLFLSIGWLLWSSPDNRKHETLLISNERPSGGDFTLDHISGKVSLSDYSDKTVMLYFGYTYCPDICPTNLGNLSMAYRQLSEQQKKHLQIIFISVDPDRDHVERLQQYANYFDANIIGLTGTTEELSEIANRYGVVYAKVDDPNNGTNYAVDHSAFTYVIAPGGELITQLPHATEPKQFIETFKRLQP
jgi:protein SCO1/2